MKRKLIVLFLTCIILFTGCESASKINEEQISENAEILVLIPYKRYSLDIIEAAFSEPAKNDILECWMPYYTYDDAPLETFHDSEDLPEVTTNNVAKESSNRYIVNVQFGQSSYDITLTIDKKGKISHYTKSLNIGG